AMLVSTWARFVTSQVSRASSPESGRRGRRRSSEKRRAPYSLVLVVQSVSREEVCLAERRKRPSRALTHGQSGVKAGLELDGFTGLDFDTPAGVGGWSGWSHGVGSFPGLEGSVRPALRRWRSR